MWLRQRRRELHISQDDLARRLQLSGIDITAGTISHWERGRHKPPMHDPDFRAAISNALELHESEVLVMAGYDVNVRDDDEIVVRAMIIMNHLPSDMKRHALEYLKMLDQQHGKATV